MKPRALVIDDDPKILEIVCEILDSLNHDCDTAEDQESARNLLAGGTYTYLLLDLEIPVRPKKLCRLQNGTNLLRQIRETPGMDALPVVVMTGHGNDSPDLAVSVWQTGADHYVKKPFSRGELDTDIREVLTRKGRPAPRWEASPSPEVCPIQR